MSIEILDLTTIEGHPAIADLAATAEAVAEAISRVNAEHPGFSYPYADEIRCDAWGCGQGFDVPVGVDCGESAARIFEDHRAERVDALLAGRYTSPCAPPTWGHAEKELKKSQARAAAALAAEAA